MIDKSKVQKTIDTIRPMLQRDGGDVELVEVTDDGIVKVRLVGACGTCPMSTLTLKNGIEAKLRQEISDVKAVEAV